MGREHGNTAHASRHSRANAFDRRCSLPKNVNYGATAKLDAVSGTVLIRLGSPTRRSSTDARMNHHFLPRKLKCVLLKNSMESLSRL
jgi:hypothetical protein